MDIIEHHGIKGMRWGHRKLNSMIDNHKENLRYKYRKAGLNEQQVEAKLQRRLKNEKRLPIVNIRKIRKLVKKMRSTMKSITGGISYGYFSIRRFWRS